MTLSPPGIDSYSTYSPYQPIKEDIFKNKNHWNGMEREFFKNDNALKLVNHLESDILRLQAQQNQLQMQMAQLQPKAGWLA